MKILKKIFRVIGKTLICIVALACILLLIVYISTEQRINKTYKVSESVVAIPSDSISISKGKHIFLIRGCGDCHGSNLAGSVFLNDPKLAQITAPNLTKGKGGLPIDYSVKDWMRTFKHGINRNGKSLLMMPSHETTRMNKEDLVNLISYCNQVAPIDNELPKLHKLGPLGRIVLLLDKATVLPAEKIDHDHADIGEERIATEIEYGKYLAVACEGCHRSNMQGGEPLAPGFPMVPNITSKGNVGTWTKEQFTQTLRTGIRPDGTILKNENMPWQTTKHFTDEEMNSLFAYLRSLPN